MKKLLTIALAGVLALSLAPVAAADPSTARVVSREYSQPNGIVIAGVVYAFFDLTADVPAFSARSGERKVSISIADDLGQPARGHIHLDRDGDGELDGARDFCGSTSKPLTITARSTLRVSVVGGTCADGTPAFATSGTVTATFHK